MRRSLCFPCRCPGPSAVACLVRSGNLCCCVFFFAYVIVKYTLYNIGQRPTLSVTSSPDQCPNNPACDGGWWCGVKMVWKRRSRFKSVCVCCVPFFTTALVFCGCFRNRSSILWASESEWEIVNFCSNIWWYPLHIITYVCCILHLHMHEHLLRQVVLTSEL